MCVPLHLSTHVKGMLFVHTVDRWDAPYRWTGKCWTILEWNSSRHNNFVTKSKTHFPMQIPHALCQYPLESCWRIRHSQGHPGSVDECWSKISYMMPPSFNCWMLFLVSPYVAGGIIYQFDSVFDGRFQYRITGKEVPVFPQQCLCFCHLFFMEFSALCWSLPTTCVWLRSCSHVTSPFTLLAASSSHTDSFTNHQSSHSNALGWSVAV